MLQLLYFLLTAQVRHQLMFSLRVKLSFFIFTVFCVRRIGMVRFNPDSGIEYSLMFGGLNDFQAILHR